MTSDRIVVIGSGVGGLASAMLLAAQGVEVVVLEKEPIAGGKMRTMNIDGLAIDCGPTVLTMLHVFERLFADCGLTLSSHVTVERASLLARHAWSSNGHLDLFADRTASRDAIGRFAGSAAAKGFDAFCAHARQVYETMNPLFMEAERPTPVSMARAAGLRGLAGLVSSAPFTTLWDLLGTYFPDPRLRQLFGRYATYCGSSPFEASATLALIPHVEMQGVWIVKGGMRALADALAGAAMRSGATIRYGVEATEILAQNGKASGVVLSTGERIAATAVISNGDVGALASGLLGAPARSAVAADGTPPRSLSAATWGFAARADGFPLAHHTVFFSGSSKLEFDDLFTRRRPPSDPTVYVCAADRHEGAPPPAQERLFMIVNAPADAGRSLARPEDIQACRTAMMRTLERCGLRLDVTGEMHAGPATFAARYPGTDGAIYGMASHGWTASFRRPGARTKLPGLYLTGGSVHPGAGLPMAALSGRLAAQAWLRDRRSI